MKTTLPLFCAFLACASAFGGVGWRNLDAEHHLAGRKASAGYLQGKVVFVCRWNASNEVNRADASLLARLEDVWDGFKTKQFVLLGSPFGGGSDTNGIRAAVEAAGVTFPVYCDAGLTNREPRVAGGLTLYVVSETGLVVYRGRDDRMATQALVQALTDMDAPKNVGQWCKFLDYEIVHLPAHAYNRLKAFGKRFPKAARDYGPKRDGLLKIENLREVADLVAFAKLAKDAPPFGAKDRAKARKYQSLVNGTLERCAPLRDVADPRLRQEAKNALADLQWIRATF